MEDSKTRFVLNFPGMKNFAWVEYFRNLENYETRLVASIILALPADKQTKFSPFLNLSRPYSWQSHPSPLLKQSCPSSPLCGGPRAAAPPSRLSAMGVAGLDSRVIPLLFLQRPLILRSGLHHPGQPQHLQPLHLLRLLLQGAGKDSQHQDQDRQIVFDIQIKIIRARVKLGSQLWC